MVWSWPMGSARSWQARERRRSGTNSWRGTFPIAARTRALVILRPGPRAVLPPCVAGRGQGDPPPPAPSRAGPFHPQSKPPTTPSSAMLASSCPQHKSEISICHVQDAMQANRATKRPDGAVVSGSGQRRLCRRSESAEDSPRLSPPTLPGGAHEGFLRFTAESKRRTGLRCQC